MHTVSVLDRVEDIKEYRPIIDPITGEESQEPVYKSTVSMNIERQLIIQAKTAEIQAKIDVYVSAQASQGIREAGPVAEFEIMKIVNEHNGEFEVVLEE